MQNAWLDAHDVAFDGAHLLGNHGIQACGHDSPRRDLDALLCAQFALPSLACERGTHHGQLRGRIQLQIRACQGKAIHRGVVVRRHRNGRYHILRQDAIERLRQWQNFGLRHRLHQLRQKFIDLAGRQRRGVVALEFSCNVGERLHAPSLSVMASI